MKTWTAEMRRQLADQMGFAHLSDAEIEAGLQAAARNIVVEHPLLATLRRVPRAGEGLR